MQKTTKGRIKLKVEEVAKKKAVPEVQKKVKMFLYDPSTTEDPKPLEDQNESQSDSDSSDMERLD